MLFLNKEIGEVNVLREIASVTYSVASCDKNGVVLVSQINVFRVVIFSEIILLRELTQAL